MTPTPTRTAHPGRRRIIKLCGAEEERKKAQMKEEESRKGGQHAQVTRIYQERGWDRTISRQEKQLNKLQGESCRLEGTGGKYVCTLYTV